MSDLHEMAWNKMYEICHEKGLKKDDYSVPKTNGTYSVRIKGILDEKITLFKCVKKNKKTYICISLKSKCKLPEHLEYEDQKYRCQPFRYYKVTSEDDLDRIIKECVLPVMNIILDTSNDENRAVVVKDKDKDVAFEKRQKGKYSEKYIIEQLNKTDINVLYRTSQINCIGKTNDSNEYYLNVVSKWLLSNLNKLNNVSKKTRGKSYCVKHSNTIKENSNRKEEEMARDCVNNSKTFDKIGTFIDYQIPLDKNKCDKLGKIDLLSINKEDRNLYIIELKRPDNTETLLRCILEIYTYYKIIDTDQLKNNVRDTFSEKYKLDNMNDFNVIPCVLVSADGEQMLEWKHLPVLKQLMDKLNVELYTYDVNDKNKIDKIYKSN